MNNISIDIRDLKSRVNNSSLNTSTNLTVDGES